MEDKPEVSPVFIKWENHTGLSKIIFSISLLLLLGNGKAKAQNSLDVIKNWTHFSDAPNSLYHYLSAQSYDMLDKRDSIIAKLHTLSDWQQRQKKIRKTLMDIVGPFPKKTPLNAKITKTIHRDGYRVEDIIYESQPGFYVTSSLFIPAGLKGKAPVIIYCSGHTNDGYRNPVYQQAILNLVKKKFIVFAFDPVDQGERDEYHDPKTGRSIIRYKDAKTGKFILGAPDHDHSYSGAQAFITGDSQARYMIWDGIRAVDYLLTRKEVDPTRIGITGRSGGGTQSAYIAAFDDRIYAAAPECYITNFTRLIQSIGPQDAEQDFYHEIANGIDHADLLEVRAPKPALMITTTRDMFPIQGARETATEASRIYKAYSREDNFKLVEDDAPHASTKKNREAMYAFFQKYLDNPGQSNDDKVNLLSKKDLQVTKTGQVSTSLGSETVFSLNKKTVEKREDKLQVSRKDLQNYLTNVLKSAKNLSGYHEPVTFHEPVFTGRFQKKGYVIEKFFVKGEGDYVIPYSLWVPDKPNNKALIYLDLNVKPIENSLLDDIKRFVRNGFTVLAPDLIGVGEMGPGEFRGDSYIGGVSYNVWFLSILIGRSIVGIRAGDVVRLTRLLQKKTNIKGVYGLARRQMGPVLLHAAAFDSSIVRIALIKTYSSYRSIAMNRFYKPSYIPSTVADALEAYDLPDLAANLAPRKLLVAGITDGRGAPASSEIIKEDMGVIKTAYQHKDAIRKLKIISWRKYINDSQDILMDWIK